MFRKVVAAPDNCGLLPHPAAADDEDGPSRAEDDVTKSLFHSSTPFIGGRKTLDNGPTRDLSHRKPRHPAALSIPAISPSHETRARSLSPGHSGRAGGM